jgi:hypothetical protein
LCADAHVASSLRELGGGALVAGTGSLAYTQAVMQRRDIDTRLPSTGQNKPVRLTAHAREQCVERGATEHEVVQAVRDGAREPAKRGRELCRFNFAYDKQWQGKLYPIKQVAPVVVEEPDEIAVITFL